MRLKTAFMITALGVSVLSVSLLTHAAFATSPVITHPAAPSGASYNETPVPVIPATSSASLLTREQIDAKAPADQGGRRVFTRLLTWSEFESIYTPGSSSPQIDGARKVWAVQTHYPDGYQTKRGLMSNAVVTAVYDAETGQVLGVIHRSMPAGERPAF